MLPPAPAAQVQPPVNSVDALVGIRQIVRDAKGDVVGHGWPGVVRLRMSWQKHRQLISARAVRRTRVVMEFDAHLMCRIHANMRR